MQPFAIFRPGRHTATDGTTLVFGTAEVQDLAESYDPLLHEAPIVIGHPKDNAPAFGWIKGLATDDNGDLVADPHQVHAAFAEAVAAGSWKKRSASVYPPSSPTNPKPGHWYLRHVAFLGAQPPAIKGLADVHFAEDEQFLEFSDPQITASIVGGIMRRLRDWLIGEKGLEEADKILPGWAVEDLEAEARRPNPQPIAEDKPTTNPMFSEPGAPTMADATPTTSTTPDLDAERAALDAERKQFAEERAAFRAAENAKEIAALVGAGKITPAQAAGMVEFMSSLDGAAEISFGEGDVSKTAKPGEFFRSFLASLQPQVDLGEHSRDKDAGPDLGNARELAAAAVEYQEAKRAKGIEMTIVQAVAEVSAGRTA